MEGRAAARPDDGVPLTRKLIMNLQWRAGQLPGLTPRTRTTTASTYILQWRAGQLPGLTRSDSAMLLGGQIPSMEGRAAARPDPTAPATPPPSSCAFNGGPGSCPA